MEMQLNVFKYYVIVHNGGVKRKSGSASQPILRFYKGLRHLTSLNVTLYIDTLYFLIHFFQLCLLEKVLVLFPQSSNSLCVYG